MNGRELLVMLQRDLAGELPLILDRDGNPIVCNETERRIERIMAGLLHLPDTRFERAELDDAELHRAIAATHDAAYLSFLRTTSENLDDGAMLLYDHRYLPPRVDPDTPIVAGIYRTALESARTAIASARAVARGAAISYALCRPPGHHAGRSWLGGHCYLNNGALALKTLMNDGFERVALLDFDIHFGNGSAAILAGIEGAFFGSIHSSTLTSYPYIPTSPPNRTQIYLPFEEAPQPEEFLDAVACLVDHARRNDCRALVISAGYDIIDGDPHGTWHLFPEILRETGQILAGADLPICIVQEGGYLLSALEECSHQFGMGLLERRALERSPLEQIPSINSL